ncbi:hypothetical protein SBV1_1930022 [Verrucomicrobia bacterium]|nr:hypothetical protein SBV1_1930022 [Verrucomicrobiota bacterium]
MSEPRESAVLWAWDLSVFPAGQQLPSAINLAWQMATDKQPKTRRPVQSASYTRIA